MPTNVVVVVSQHEGHPIGMVVGTFTSVSLAPTMVGFLGDLSSTTLPMLKEAGRISFSVLSRKAFPGVTDAFHRPSTQRFESVNWSDSPSGLPRITDAVLYVEGPIIDVVTAGDHKIVQVTPECVDPGGGESPLVFWGGRMMGVRDTSLPEPIWQLGGVGEWEKSSTDLTPTVH